MRTLRRLVCVAIAALAASAPAAAKPPHAGSLDRSFGENGRVVLNLPGERMRPRAMLVQSDGKIVVAGYLTDSANRLDYPAVASGRAFAVRFLADGSLDRSFGEGGVARIRLRLPVRVSGLAVQPDGALLLAGTAYDEPGRDLGAVLRLRPDGALDDHFGIGGLATVEGENVNPNVVSPVYDLTQLGVHPDGRILAAGTQRAYDVHSAVDPFMIRLLPDGAPDPSFDGNGAARAGPQWPSEMVPQGDGSLVVLGKVDDFFGEDLFAAYRATPGAGTDTTASYQWKRIVTVGAANLQPNGDILIIGSMQVSDARHVLAWVRIGPDLELVERDTARSPDPVEGGTFDRRGAFITMAGHGPWYAFNVSRFRGRRFHQDRSFGDAEGQALIPTRYPGMAIGMEMQAADKLIVAGYTALTDPADDEPLALYRLHARQDAAPPMLRVTGVRPRACLDTRRRILVRTRDESRFLVRVSVDGRRIKQTRKRRSAVALHPAKLDPGRRRLTVTATDAAGNRSRRERTFHVCR